MRLADLMADYMAKLPSFTQISQPIAARKNQIHVSAKLYISLSVDRTSGLFVKYRKDKCEIWQFQESIILAI